MKIKLSKSTFTNILLLITSIFIFLGICEITLRLYHSKLFRWKNFLKETVNLNKSAYPSVYDSKLGWIPQEGAAGKDNIWGTEVTILKNGIRSNSLDTRFHLEEGKIIMAVGNSFTFGDEVSDHETWPAFLENMLNIRIINAGVFGYGLDQIVIRAEQLIPLFHPKIIIVSCVPDDVRRCELSVRQGTPKPYFRVIDNQLLLKNIPVPIRSVKEGEMDFFRRNLGYSLLANFIMKRINRKYWMLGTLHENIPTGENGLLITSHLFDRLEALQDANSLKIVILMQYYFLPTEADDRIRNEILTILKQKKLDVVDLYQPLNVLKQNNPDIYQQLYEAHMSAEGNKWVAAILADFLSIIDK